MNKNLKYLTLVAGIIWYSLTSVIYGQTTVPPAGITPESNFYFLDKLGETLREFLTFGPESKARLQITFAAERVAEIKIILETKGVDARGLEVAQNRLQAHIANATAIVDEQKASGENVSDLAKELSDKLEAPKSVLAQSFKEQERALETRENELKSQLKAAHQAGDTVKEESLVGKLGQIKAQKELLELKEEDIEDELREEEDKLEEEMELKEDAEKTIKEAEKEKQELLNETTEEELIIPLGAFGNFDSLLNQAKSAFTSGKYPEARRLAKQAEKSLDAVEKVIERLEEAKEEQEELTEKQEERIKEEAEKEKKRLREKIGQEEDDESEEPDKED